MNKKDILIAGLCLTILGGCTFKLIKTVKKRKNQEDVNCEEMVYTDGE